MTVTFRPATREDVARAEAAIESFVASFDGKSLVSDALGSLVAGLRDSLLDRDLDGDADLLTLVVDARLHAHAVIDAPSTEVPDPAEIDDAIRAACARVPEDIARISDLGLAISTVIKACDPLIERGFPNEPTMPESSPKDLRMVLLRRTLEDLSRKQLKRGVLTDPAGGWPAIHESLISTLRNCFHVAVEALPTADGRPAPGRRVGDMAVQSQPSADGWTLAFARRSAGEQLIVWPRAEKTGHPLGLREMREASSALLQVASIFHHGAARSVANLAEMKVRQQLNSRKNQELERDAAAMRGRILKIPGLLDNLSDSAAVRLRIWLKEGKAFPVSDPVKRTASSAELEIRREIRDLFGPDLQQTLRAAMFGTPDRSLPSLSILHDRLSERFGRSDPGREF